MADNPVSSRSGAIAIDTETGVMSRWFIVNFMWVAVIFASYQQGWFHYIFAKDETYISHFLALAGLIMVLISTRKAFVISRLLKNPLQATEEYKKRVADRSRQKRDETKGLLANELMGYINSIEFIGTMALTIGVVGTVIGLIIGFQSIDPSALANIENVAPAVSKILTGLSIAFHTTLVGSFVYIWLRTNHYMLVQASTNLYNKILGG